MTRQQGHYFYKYQPAAEGLLDAQPISLGSLSWFDLMSLAIYLAALLCVTLYVNRRVGSADSEHYFLGGRNIQWWAIGFSLFASNLGTDHLVGLAGSGAAGGLAVGNYEFSACPILLVLGWAFVPYYLAYEVFTVPEFLEKRFGRSLRIFFTWLTILSTIVTKIAVTIFAGSVVLKEVLGWNMWMSSTILLLLTGCYTAIGGLAAVLYTEVLQSIFLIIGSIALLHFGMQAAGGWSGLREALPDSKFTLLKPLDHPDFPWIGVLFGMPINSLWYWCTDQVMVQRVLATDQPAVSQQGCVFAGWMKLLPMYIMVLPGLVAAALYPAEIERDSNRAYALLVTRLLPHGWVGVMIAVMLSSFMAALASCFNSCSTLFTLDVYADMYPGQSEEHLVKVGRAFTFAIAVFSLAWLPMIGQSDQLFLYIQSMQVIWAAPVAVTFLGARFLPGMTTLNAWVTLGLGITFGLVFWIIQNALPRAVVTSAGLGQVAEFNILHFTIVSFLLCGALLLVCHALQKRVATEEERAGLVSGAQIFETKLAKQDAAGAGAKCFAVSLIAVFIGLTVLHSIPLV